MTKKRLCFISLILIALIIASSLLYLLIDSSIAQFDINGDKTITITYNSEYKEPGVTAKNVKDFDEKKVVIESSLDTSKVGSYVIKYHYQTNKQTLTAERIVKVIDAIAPVITLKGKDVIQLNVGQSYQEAGYEAQDEYDGDLTKMVKVEGNVDTSKIGTYIITYIVSDLSGNQSTTSRKIEVIDNIAPVITLKDGTSFIKLGSPYQDPGYTASDNLDGDLSNKVTVKNEVNTKKAGTYYITYSVEDSSGNKTSVTRRINVFQPNGTLKNIYLTFDDGPSSTTPEILAILKQKGVKATFFVSPNKAYYKYLNDIVEDGHELAIHGYHQYKPLYASADSFFHYFTSMQNDIKAQTGLTIRTFRFPGGSNTVYLKRSVFDEINAKFKSMGVIYYDWNVSSQDATGKYMSKNDIANAVFQQVIYTSRKENIILMHDLANKKATREALPQIIDTFKELGYEFRTVSESSFAPQFRY